MGLPRTTKSSLVTVRLNNEKLGAVETTAAEHGLTRHSLIKACLYHAVGTGSISEIARAAQKVKAPA